MRKFKLHISILLFACLFLTACDKNDDPVPDKVSFKGDFVSAVHTTSGVATIDLAETTLTLTNFKTDSGPDLNMYLAASSSTVTSDFLDLGDIKGVNGTYTYDLPDNVNFSHYKYVVVWCVDFNVNFGYAELAEQ